MVYCIWSETDYDPSLHLLDRWSVHIGQCDYKPRDDSAEPQTH